MLQHRHVFPGYEGPKNDPDGSKWWHACTMVHRKYPTAHEVILEEREFTPGTRTKKAVDPMYAYAPEYGPTKEEALYETPPEYAVAEAVKEAEDLVRIPARK